MTMKHSLFVLFIGLSLFAEAQFNFSERENQLSQLLDAVRAAKTNSDKETHNKTFKDLLEKTLHEPTIFDCSFTQMKTLGVIDSPDRLLRIINWNIEQEDGSQKYYGFVVHRNKVKNSDDIKVVEMIDQSATMYGKTEEILEASNWYGALYYSIIPIEKNGKTYYTLLGWIDGSKMSNKKVIDVLSIAGKTVKFGNSVFRLGNTTAKRIFFEYSERAAMSLKYESDYKRIIFDHLSPETPGMEGMYAYYVPDLSYDAFVFEDNKWVLKEDVIGLNKKQDKVKQSNIDSKTGALVSKETESKWIDPTSDKVNKGDVHVAVMPDQTTENTTERKPGKLTKKDLKNLSALERYELERYHKKVKDSNSSVYIKSKKKDKK
jgi:hypothetical protein